MIRVLITLGSNQDKEHNLPAAVEALRAHPSMTLLKVSPTYETPAVGRDGKPSQQPAFHNSAALVETALTPDNLRQELRTIEADLGRVRTADKYAARPIDLDIALYSDWVVETDGFAIPDPEIGRFPHLAYPLADLAPDWMIPGMGQTLRQAAESLAAKQTSNHEMEIVQL